MQPRSAWEAGCSPQGITTPEGEASEIFSSKLRFLWEYLPGSELFGVWTDGQNYTSPERFGGLRSHGFTVMRTQPLRL